MTKDTIIAEIIKRIKRRDLSYSIKNYLKSINIEEEQADAYILEAKNILKDKKRQRLPKLNKLIFGGALAIAIGSFILFFFILPRNNYTSHNWLAILGAALFVISSLIALFFRNSWKPDRVEVQLETKGGSSDFGSIMLVLGLVPAVIIYFIFSWNFESVQEDILKSTQVDAIATVVTGTSLTSRRMDFSEITVTFTTKEGKKIKATKDMYEHEFKKYYKGQQIPIIYSSTNPEVIEFMTVNYRVKEYKEFE